MKSRYVTHVVKVNDTIQSIGILYGVDWTKLVIVNGLEYPYIDSEIGSTKYADTNEVAKIGDRLVIPTQGLHIPQKTNNSTQELENYAFGCDLDLFSSTVIGDNVTNVESLGELSAGDDGDVLLSEGTFNLRQQLITRLGTPKGSLMSHPEFGSELYKHIGAKLTLERLIKIKLCIQECILGDFRVIGVSDMRAIFRQSGGATQGSTMTSKGLFIDFIVHPIEPYAVFKIGKTLE